MLCSTCRKKKKGKCEGLCIEKLGAVEMCTSYCDYRKNRIVELIKNFLHRKMNKNELISAVTEKTELNKKKEELWRSI